MQGDGNIRYYEVVDKAPHVYFLNQHTSDKPQRGLGNTSFYVTWTDIDGWARNTLCPQKTTLMLHTIDSTHVNRFR